MLAPRLRQSMSYSLWFSISVFILDLSSCPRVSEGGRQGRETRAGTMRRGCQKLRGILTAAISSETAYPTGEELLFAMDYCMGT